VRRPTGDDGQIMILSIGFMVVVLLLVTAVVSATGIHVERKRLLAAADSIVVEAADELSTPEYFPAGPDGFAATGAIRLTDQDVRRAIDTYLADNPAVAARFEGFQVLDATSDDGRSAHVRLGALARPALISWVTAPWSDGIALEAESSARTW
jgi:hypothetical protein